MKKIKLTRNKYALVDDEDFENLSKCKWYASARGYAANGSLGFMHRVVNKTPEGMQTDHIDGNKLNNQRKNLRTCTDRQNKYNTKKRITNASGYKGVTLQKETLRWRAEIWLNGKNRHLGYFKSRKQAHKAYCEASKIYHKEFSNTK